jgi:A/G-specific adenine glycosylase
LWAFAESILPRSNCGTFNQALMELGATICTPKSPRCEICPVAALCPTHARGLQDRIPRPRPRPRVEQVAEALVVIRRRGKVLLVRHGENGRWGRLWDFIRLPLPPTRSVSEAGRLAEIRRQITRRTGFFVPRCVPVTMISHTVTRFRITLFCFEKSRRHLLGQAERIAKFSSE